MEESATPSAESERWLPVVGWESFYQVSDLGRVRSMPRMVRTTYGSLRHYAGKILKPSRNGDYYCVNLSCDGKKQHVRIHVLVAEAFLGPRPADQLVCHGPAGSLDNSVVNLSYGTHAKNSGPDRYRDGTINTGNRNGFAKLTDELVRECRARAAAGQSAGAIAREFGVSREAVRLVLVGVRWRHVA